MKASIIILAIGTLAPVAICAHAHEKNGSQRSFVKNTGQWSDPGLYRAGLGELALFIERNAFTWSMLDAASMEGLHDAPQMPVEQMMAMQLKGHAWQMRFANTSGAREMIEHRPFDAYFNYFIGNDPTQWRSRVPLFRAITMQDMWPGVDVRTSFSNGAFKYDIIVHPHADMRPVAMQYKGLDGISINGNGALVLRTSVGQITEVIPVSWYVDDPGTTLDCRYELDGDMVRFVLPEDVDRSRAIVIDPVLIASTLSGTGDIGTTSNYGHSATFDDQGNIYTGARCFGQGYPTVLGAFQTTYGGGGTDISISKLNPDGSDLIYGTYIGGSNIEYPHSLIVDNAGRLIVYGSSQSTNFPTSSNAFDGTYNSTGGFAYDIVISKLSPDGTMLIGSTYVGGSESDGSNQISFNYGDAFRGEVIVDGNNNCYVASCTNSPNFPATAGAFQTMHGGQQDGVVFSLNDDLSMMRWCTYLGGASGDMAFGLKLNAQGDVFVGGSTENATFPTTPGSYQPAYAGGTHDAFIMLLEDDGTTMGACTFYGTSEEDQAFFLDTDLDGNVFIFGQSEGAIPVFPAGVHNNPGTDIFVAKFTGDLSTAVFSSSVGQTGGFGFSMVPVAFLVDVCDHIYISGYSVGSGLDLTADAIYNSGGFYLAIYDVDMTSLLYGTYYDGANHVDGGTSRFDKNGFVYQGVCTIGPFPTTPNAWSSTQPGGWDVGVFKIDFEQAGVQAYITLNGPNIGCVPATFDFTASGSATTYAWDMGDGSPQQSGLNVTHTYTQAGAYTITLIGTDSNTCNIADTTTFLVNVNEPGSLQAAFVAQQSPDCSQIQVVATNTTLGVAMVAEWNMGDGTTLFGNTVTHVYPGPGTYTITLFVTDTLCNDSSTIAQQVTFTTGLNVDIGPDVTICPGASATLSAAIANASYLWSTGATSQSITVSDPGDYWVEVNAQGCIGMDTLSVGMYPDPGPLDFTEETCPGLGAALTIPINGTAYSWLIGGNTQTIFVEDTGSYVFTVTDANGCDFSGVAELTVFEGAFDVLIPNVISPNGDGLNDRFEPQTGGYQDVDVKIYNRWGKEMFHSPNLSKLWDGQFNTKNVPDGTYFYIVTYKNSCEEGLRVETGHVTVLR